MLPVHAYHRYHLPVGGLVKESFRIHRKVFMRVGIEDHQLRGSDSAGTGYEFSQTRGVVTIDTSAATAEISASSRSSPWVWPTCRRWC
jgi:phosphatidylserine decarboxylase